jgi:hypothetical protein
MHLEEQDKEHLIEILSRDVEVFKKHNIMDYSLLLGVTFNPDIPLKDREELMDPSSRVKEYYHDHNFINDLRLKYKNNRNVWVSSKGIFIYYFAVIDYLQAFDKWKKLENRFKTWRHGKKGIKEVSAIDPSPYAARFLNFMKKKVFLLK